MPVAIIPQIGSYIFLPSLSVLSIAGAGESPSTLTVEIDGREVFSNRYIPSPDGEIIVFDIDKVVKAAMTGTTEATMVMKLDDTLLSHPSGTTVVYSSTDVADDPAAFIDDFFLTPSMSERSTAPGRYECLSAFCREMEQVEVTCTYFHADTAKLSTTTSVYPGALGLVTLDVSPDRFAAEGKMLVKISVRLGSRRADYRVESNRHDSDPAVIFRNRFNAWETLHLYGLKETAPAYERSTAMTGGRLVTYDIAETVLYKAHSGPLRPGEVPVAMDLATALEVYLLNSDGSPGEELVITDTDIKHLNDLSSLPDFTFTYRRASRYTSRLSVSRQPRVFDPTFDETFF